MNDQFGHKGQFYINIQKHSTFTIINIIDVYAKFAIEWQPLIGVNIMTRAPNTKKNQEHFHNLIISKLHGSCVFLCTIVVEIMALLNMKKEPF